VPNWQRLALNGQRIGRHAARVTIVEFSDFQCPFCALAEDSIQHIRRDFPEAVAIVYRHMPLTAIHPLALAAAEASECAAIQGHFQSFHDQVFAHQNQLGMRSWVSFAVAAEISDVAAFQNCVTEELMRPNVERDLAAGRAAGVTGTPTFFINGLRYQGVPTLERLRNMVRRAQ
jgi:protein-disulfide isomerase